MNTGDFAFANFALAAHANARRRDADNFVSNAQVSRAQKKFAMQAEKVARRRVALI